MKHVLMLFTSAMILVVSTIYNFGISLALAQSNNTTASNMTGSTSVSNMTGKNDTSCNIAAQMQSLCNASPSPK